MGRVSDSHVITARHVTLSYGSDSVLDDISLSVERGSIVGLEGQNGSGKSTLIHALAGLIKPTAGQLSVFGESPWKASSAWRSQVGASFQRPCLPRELTVSRCLNLLAGYYDNARDPQEILQLLQLREFETTPVAQLSGGLEHKVDLAAALIGRPQLLLLDEPTASLDPASRDIVWATICDHNQSGITVIFSTQWESETSRYATHRFRVTGKTLLETDLRP